MSGGGYQLSSDYNDVPSRIAEFRDKHPLGSLAQADLQFIDFGGKSWVVYTAAAYRTPDDAQPGIGTAWEPVPGKTPFTRDSELQNAETAAWGRAIIAVGAADAKRIASAEEVRNRAVDRDPVETDPRQELRATVARMGAELGWTATDTAADFKSWSKGLHPSEASESQLSGYIEYLSRTDAP